MPLVVAPVGKDVRVVKILADEKTKKHLEKYLMKKYNIPKNRVVRHFDVNGKNCPGLVGWNTGSLYDDNGKKIG